MAVSRRARGAVRQTLCWEGAGTEEGVLTRSLVDPGPVLRMGGRVVWVCSPVSEEHTANSPSTMGTDYLSPEGMHLGT